MTDPSLMSARMSFPSIPNVTFSPESPGGPTPCNSQAFLKPPDFGAEAPPCQPYSGAGKELGDADERNLWPAFFNLIKVCRPERIFGEQVENAVRHGWLDGISTDLEQEGYTVGAVVLGAHSAGAPHTRQRLFFTTHSDGDGVQGLRVRSGTAGEAGPWRAYSKVALLASDGLANGQSWPQPLVRPVDDGLPVAMGLLRGYGNSIVPQIAAKFIEAAFANRGDRLGLIPDFD